MAKTRSFEDLTRIVGIGRDYAGILEAAGIRSIQELAIQDPTDLADLLLEVNLLKGLVMAVPSEKRVSGWVRQAQGLLIGH